MGIAWRNILWLVLVLQHIDNIHQALSICIHWKVETLLTLNLFCMHCTYLKTNIFLRVAFCTSFEIPTMNLPRSPSINTALKTVPWSSSAESLTCQNSMWLFCKFLKSWSHPWILNLFSYFLQHQKFYSNLSLCKNAISNLMTIFFHGFHYK
jgi:hypothetical protein